MRFVSIRTKLLLLLLALALGSLAVVAVIDYRSTRRMGSVFAEEVSTTLERRAQAELARFIRLSGDRLAMERELLELMVLAQADAAGEVLSADAATLPPATVLFEEDYLAADADARVPGRTTDPAFVRLNARGEAEPMLVTFERQVFVRPPGLSADAARPDAQRLATLTPEYRRLRAGHARDVLWQYTALPTGLMGSFPGRGGYPAGYDPRVRLWYQLASELDGSESVAWSRPIIDATTRRLLLTCAAPVRSPDGTLRAVTALDVSLTDILARAAPPGELTDRSIALLVQMSWPGVLPDGVAPQPVVLAEREGSELPRAAGEPGRWDVLPGVEPLADRTDDSLTDILAALTDGGSAVVRKPYRGVDSLWAYGTPGDPGVLLVVVVPYESIVEAATTARAFVNQRTRQRQLASLGALAVLGGLVTFVALGASRSVTRPVRELTAAAARVAEGDLDTQAAVARTGDEIQRLGEAFNQMVPKLRERVALRESLRLARAVQQRLLPAESPALPGWDLAGVSRYCDDTGGDYFDYLPVSPGHLGMPTGGVLLVLGDVTGHGVSAALLMTTARAIMRSTIDEAPTIAAWLAGVNRALTADSDAGRFMTLFALALPAIDAARPPARDDAMIRWASAGHDPAIVLAPGGPEDDAIAGEDIPLGVQHPWSFHEFERPVPAPGAVLAIGSDGIWEAMGPRGERYGKARWRAAMAACPPDAAAADIANAAIADLDRFRAESSQADDITLLLARRLG